MAGYDAFDPRLESLVVETKTHWADDVEQLTEEEQSVISKAIHRHPQLASRIHYERTHTGFIREVTISESDVERLYHHNLSTSESP